METIGSQEPLNTAELLAQCGLNEQEIAKIGNISEEEREELHYVLNNEEHQYLIDRGSAKIIMPFRDEEDGRFRIVVNYVPTRSLLS